MDEPGKAHAHGDQRARQALRKVAAEEGKMHKRPLGSNQPIRRNPPATSQPQGEEMLPEPTKATRCKDDPMVRAWC